jgi:hypothetical protein
VNLSEFNSYRLIGKLTVFLQLQEFSQRNQIWDHSYMGVFFHFRRAAFSSMLKSRVSSILVKTAALRINLNLDGRLSPLSHILTHRIRKLLVH